MLTSPATPAASAPGGRRLSSAEGRHILGEVVSGHVLRAAAPVRHCTDYDTLHRRARARPAARRDLAVRQTGQRKQLLKANRAE